MIKLRAFTMPKWGIEMREGTIGEWNVREGDNVQKGQVLAQIETDKIVNEVVSEFDMTILRIIGATGETYSVGALLAVMSTGPASPEEIGEFILEFQTASGAALGVPADTTSPPNGAAQGNVPTVTVRSQIGEPTQSISAAAWEFATARGMDITQIPGSGRVGRITLQDVNQATKPMRTPQDSGPVSIMPRSGATIDDFYASPFAKRLAFEHAIDLSTISGTGPNGRISRSDVISASGISLPRLHARRPQIIRMSATRKAIARQLTISKTTIPHFYLRVQVNMDALLDLRLHLRRAESTTPVPTVNDYFIRAAALGLAKHIDLNVQVHGDEIHRFPTADISMAVAADRGLITPVVRNAESKTVTAIASESRTLIERARAGKLQSDEMTGGCLTVSNLGMFGVEQFDAIINPPQAAILAVGAPRRVATDPDGRLRFASLAWISLSCDHRAIDGATGARFLATLRELIETPTKL